MIGGEKKLDKKVCKHCGLTIVKNGKANLENSGWRHESKGLSGTVVHYYLCTMPNENLKNANLEGCYAEPVGYEKCINCGLGIRPVKSKTKKGHTKKSPTNWKHEAGDCYQCKNAMISTDIDEPVKSQLSNKVIGMVATPPKKDVHKSDAVTITNKGYMSNWDGVIQYPSQLKDIKESLAKSLAESLGITLKTINPATKDQLTVDSISTDSTTDKANVKEHSTLTVKGQTFRRFTKKDSYELHYILWGDHGYVCTTFTKNYAGQYIVFEDVSIHSPNGEGKKEWCEVCNRQCFSDYEYDTDKFENMKKNSQCWEAMAEVYFARLYDTSLFQNFANDVHGHWGVSPSIINVSPVVADSAAKAVLAEGRKVKL